MMDLFLVCLLSACILLPLIAFALSVLQLPCFFSLMKWLFPEVLWEVDTGGERVAALTIDDSPTDSLPSILDALALHNVRATFFFISGHMEDDTHWSVKWARRFLACLTLRKAQGDDDVSDRRAKRTAAVKRLVQEGHELANHGTEDHKACCLGSAAFESSLLRCEQAIEEVVHAARRAETKPVRGSCMAGGDYMDAAEPSGQSEIECANENSDRILTEATPEEGDGDASSDRGSKYYRPGGGVFHLRMLRQAAALAYRVVLGNIFPYDAAPCFLCRCPHRVKVCWLVRKVRPGAIIIIHDRWYTPSLLEEALPRILHERKIKLVPLSELVACGQPPSAEERTKAAPGCEGHEDDLCKAAWR